MEEPLDLDAPLASDEALLDKVRRRIERAVDQGRSSEALRWMRVHDMLARSALNRAAEKRSDTFSHMREVYDVAESITRAARAAQADNADLDDLLAALDQARAPALEKLESQSPHSNPPPRPLNRAERRRRARAALRDP